MVTVTNADELVLVLESAQAGDTIVLAGGDYGDVTIDGAAYADFVTIVSADSSDPAVFDSLSVKNASYLRFDGIKIEHILEPDEPDWVPGMRVDQSDHIEIINSEFTGSVDGDYSNDGQGLLVLDSSDIVVENNTFHDLKAGAGFGRSEYVEVLGNSFFDIRSDGINFDATSHVLIEGNSLTDFHPVSGDHPDMIQFYNEAASGDMVDVVIRDNTLTQGTGAPVQGIFIEGTSSSGSHPYGSSGFVIDGNTIELGSSQGIWVYNVDDLSITDNVLTQADGGTLAPSIYTVETTGTEISGNTAPLISDNGSNGLTYDDNAITGSSTSIYGTAGDDTLIGGDGNDAINAGAGNDVIQAGGGNDGVFGGGGNDVIYGAAGDDTLYGDGGNDAINGGAGSDTIYCGDGNDGVFGGGGNDTIIGQAGNDVLFGDGGNDFLNGGSGNDILHGGSGNDGFYGGGGDDSIYGEAGADALFGDGGNDVLTGGTGDDLLFGGSGADVFVFGSYDGADTISDFEAIDALQFSLNDFESTADVLAAATQIGDDTVISIGDGNTVTLLHVSVADLSEGQFILA